MRSPCVTPCEQNTPGSASARGFLFVRRRGSPVGSRHEAVIRREDADGGESDSEVFGKAAQEGRPCEPKLTCRNQRGADSRREPAGWCGNEEDGAGRQFSRRESLPAESRWPSAEVRPQRRITLVNAAFLLVTTAWFAGADAAPAAAAAPAASAVTAPATIGTPITSGVAGGVVGGSCGGGGGAGCSSGCGGDCGCGCETDCCCKPSCLQRLMARCHRNKCCDCCNTCNTCATTSCCNTGCNSGCGSSCGNVSCGCGSCCETCCKPSLCQRLKCRMHRNNCCCDSCCDSGCGSGCGGGGCGGGGAYSGVGVGGLGAPAVMPGAGEPIKVLPKDATPGNKLPSDKKGSVQSNGPGVTPTSSNVLEAETKSPF